MGKFARTRDYNDDEDDDVDDDTYHTRLSKHRTRAGAREVREKEEEKEEKSPGGSITRTSFLFATCVRVVLWFYVGDIGGRILCIMHGLA